MLGSRVFQGVVMQDVPIIYTSDYYIDSLYDLKKRENNVLDQAIRIPLSTFCGENLAAAIKKNLVFNWTGRFLHSEKAALHDIARERTVLKMQRIKKKLEKIPRFNVNKLSLETVRDLVDSEGCHEKRNIRTALREVKAYTKGTNIPHLRETLADITEILSEEYRDCPYKLKLAGGIYVKDKGEEGSLVSLPHKISSNISKTAKFLNNVFTVLALTGAILSLLAIFFPFLGALAAGMLTVGTIGICLCAIVLSLKQLAKTVINWFYLDIPIDGWEMLLNIFNLVISVIFVVVGISAFMPASESSFMAYSPDVIKDLVTYVYASVTAAKNFLEAKVSVEILTNIWRIIVWLAQLAWPYILRGLVALKDGLSWLYQKTSDFIHDRYCNNISPHLPEVPPFVGTIANATSSAWSTVSDTASVVATAVKNAVATTGLCLPSQSLSYSGEE